MTEADGTGIGHSQLTVTLGRGDLGAKLECRALSPTLDVPMAAWVEVDVYGKLILMMIIMMMMIYKTERV